MNISKPITILREEFVISLIELINNSGLPSYVMEPIVKDVYTELTYLTKKQLQEDKIRYEEMLSDNYNNDSYTENVEFE